MTGRGTLLASDEACTTRSTPERVSGVRRLKPPERATVAVWSVRQPPVMPGAVWSSTLWPAAEIGAVPVILTGWLYFGRRVLTRSWSEVPDAAALAFVDCPGRAAAVAMATAQVGSASAVAAMVN